MNKIYLAGHMLTKGAQLQRKLEKEELAALSPDIQFYVPQENKEINDKENANPEGLAERIVRHDTDAIKWADTIVIEPLPEALGTHVELGQIKGMKDVAKEIVRLNELASSPVEFSVLVSRLASDILAQRVYPHYEDIRRVDGITESGDRRSLGINQYVYGVCLDVSNGKGFYNWEEIKKDVLLENSHIPF